MKIIRRTSLFKRDVKRIHKREKEFEVFKRVINELASGQKLAPKYRDHILFGQYKGARECHIEPDWLLIYELTEEELLLIRTGTHSDLFK
jgi:mRNA interferase YafQ